MHPYSRFNVKFPPSDEAVRDFILDAYATTTSITDLTPDLDYSVSINSFDGSEESIPIFGQLTSKYRFFLEIVCKLSIKLLIKKKWLCPLLFQEANTRSDLN